MNSFLLWLNLSVANGFSDIKNPSNLSCLWRIIKILISSFVCDNHILFKAIRKMPPKTSFFLTECRTFHSFELVISSNIINMNLTSFRNENVILLQSKQRWQIEHQAKYRHANDMRTTCVWIFMSCILQEPFVANFSWLANVGLMKVANGNALDGDYNGWNGMSSIWFNLCFYFWKFGVNIISAHSCVFHISFVKLSVIELIQISSYFNYDTLTMTTIT